MPMFELGCEMAVIMIVGILRHTHIPSTHTPHSHTAAAAVGELAIVFGGAKEYA